MATIVYTGGPADGTVEERTMWMTGPSDITSVYSDDGKPRQCTYRFAREDENDRWIYEYVAGSDTDQISVDNIALMFQPTRGDDVEAWLKERRDRWKPRWDGAGGNRQVYDVLDDMLDEYRERADTGTPLAAEMERR